MDNVKLLEELNAHKDSFYKEIAKVIIGQNNVIEHIFIALLFFVGLSVYKPSTSLSIINKSASIICATLAASLSLSP